MYVGVRAHTRVCLPPNAQQQKDRLLRTPYAAKRSNTAYAVRGAEVYHCVRRTQPRGHLPSWTLCLEPLIADLARSMVAMCLFTCVRASVCFCVRARKRVFLCACARTYVRACLRASIRLARPTLSTKEANCSAGVVTQSSDLLVLLEIMFRSSCFRAPYMITASSATVTSRGWVHEGLGRLCACAFVRALIVLRNSC